MKRFFVFLAMVAMVTMLSVGCTLPDGLIENPSSPSATEESNFRFLISDEVNDIDQFEHLYIHISSIGLHRSGNDGEWLELEPDPNAYDDPELGIDLVGLKGENAMVIWSGTVPSDNYTKVFIYVDKVTGILLDPEGQEADVKLPGDKLQISKSFEVSEDQEVNFVYDVTVVQAGNSGKYNLKPQIAQSGADQKFNEVMPRGATERHEEKNKEKNQEQHDLEEEFEGTILSIGEDGIWTMDIDGEEWTIDVSGADIEGEPAVDLEAEVNGIIEGDTIIASKVVIRERRGKQSGKQGD